MNSIVGTFQNFRQILCLCPCCGDIHRLSDLHLRYKGAIKKTWLDTYNAKEEKLQKQEDNFLEKEKKLREKAREQGRKLAQETIKKLLAPEFKRLRLNPYDIKPLLHPIDFLVFKGMNEQETIDKIILLSKNSKNKDLNAIRCSVKDVIQKGEYDWKTIRVDEAGKMGFE